MAVKCPMIKGEKMKLIIKPRCSGKTTELIKISAETDVPILVGNRQQSEYIKRMAHDLRLWIKDPYIISELKNSDRIPPNKILIDDAEYILQQLIGAEITAMTISNNENPLEIELLTESRKEYV